MAHRIRWNTRAIPREAAEKPETDVDSMDYNITLLSG
jgi:hypothetical protein